MVFPLQVRKQQKEHTNLIAEYRSKQQQHQQGSGLLSQGHSSQGGPPHMFPKMPGQMVMGQQTPPVMGQHPGMMPQGGMPVRMPQGQSFVGGPQTQLPSNMGGGIRPPGPPGAPPGFFPQGPGMQGADARLMQERQLQHRMQMAKLQQQQQQQQQAMMGQQAMQHPGNQQPQPGMMGHPLMAQQATAQQTMLANQGHQQGMMQVPQGMGGGQPVAPLPAGQPLNHAQPMMAPQPGMMANQQVPMSQQQRQQVMLGQQGMGAPPGHPGMRGPPVQLTPQQQNMLAQQMMASQQQQHHQQQMAQKSQQPQGVNQTTQQEQEAPSQPSTPQMGSSPSTGSVTPQPQGTTDGQNAAPKEMGILSPDSRSQLQHSGPSTPGQVNQPSAANDHHTGERQQLQQQQLNPHSLPEQQPGLVGNQPFGLQQQQQQQLPFTHQRQGSLSGDKPGLMAVKEEGKPVDISSQQQQQVLPNAMHQSQDPSVQQQQAMGQAHPLQSQSMMMGHGPQQQALMAQQQKQQAMMGMMRAQQQQQGMPPQRPALPPGQIRTSINIQAIIAQNPQLRNLPPNQQLQHIQAMIAQRQLQQGQMLRMSMGQGQMRPHMAPGQVPHGMEGQQMLPGAMGKPGMAANQQQPGMLQPGVAPPMQQGMMVPGQQQPQVGDMMQNLPRGPPPMPQSPLDHGRMLMPASPRQPLASSPGDPRHAFNQAMGMRPPTPTQNQQALMAAAAGRVQGSPSHAYSPRGPFGMSPAHSGSPHSSHVPSPSMGDSRAGRGSPYSHIKASPLRSPGAKSPLDSIGMMKVESQVLGGDTQATLVVPNGPQKSGGAAQQSQQAAEAPHTQPISRAGELCKVTLQNIKQEPGEIQCDGATEAHGRAVKQETSGETVTPGNNEGNAAGDPASQGLRSETGQQLLQKLLRTKNLQLGAQRPSEGIHSEINGHINSKLAMLEQKLQGTPQNMEVWLT